jgi:hypothetical protein
MKIRLPELQPLLNVASLGEWLPLWAIGSKL